MLIIIVMMALVAIYAGAQRIRRDKIEQVIITPVAAPTASPAAP
jgi:hypothetical protein